MRTVLGEDVVLAIEVRDLRELRLDLEDRGRRQVEDLGTVFELMKTAVKPYPSCRYGHAGIDAVLALRPQRLGDVPRIVVAAPALGYTFAGKGLQHVTVPVQLWRAGDGANGAQQIVRTLRVGKEPAHGREEAGPVEVVDDHIVAALRA